MVKTCSILSQKCVNKDDGSKNLRDVDRIVPHHLKSE